jgi:O-antigen/teichoic acid export membrane protein
MWFAVCSFLQKGISLVTIPIFTRILTETEYGRFSVYQSWLTIFQVLCTLYLYAGVFNNGLLKYEDDVDAFHSSMMGLSITVTMLWVVVYIPFFKFWNELLNLNTFLVCMLFVECIFSTAISFWSARLRFNYEYKALIFVTLIIALLSPSLGIFGVMHTTRFKTELRILGDVAPKFIIGGILIFICIKGGKKFFQRNYWKFALNFNVPLIPHYLSQTILSQSDRIMIGNMVGEDKAAIYSIAYSAAMVMTIVTQSINASFVPWTYRTMQDRAYNNLKKTSNVLLVLIGGISLLMMAFAPELIMLMAGESYSEAVAIIPPVAASVYFMFLFPLFGNIEFYFERTKFIMVASSIAAVINLILNYIAIPRFGYIAAGYTTLICYIILTLAHYVFMKYLCKKECIEESIYDEKFIAIFSAVFLIFTAIFTLILKQTLIRYLIVISIVAVFIFKRKKVISIVKNLKG